MDCTLTPKEKQASRPYRHAKDLDDLKDFGPVLEWGSIPTGHSLQDSSLSIRFVKRNGLPTWIYLIGAEYDMLATDTRRLILLGLTHKSRMMGYMFGNIPSSRPWSEMSDSQWKRLLALPCLSSLAS